MSFLKKLKATFMEVFFEKKKTKSSRKKTSKPRKTGKKSASKKSKASVSKAKKVPAKKTLKAAAKPSNKPGKTPKLKVQSVKPEPASKKKVLEAKSAVKAETPKPDKKEKTKGAKVGMVTHFFPQVNAAAIKVSGSIQVGDILEFKGATTHFRLKISSMQINRVPVTQASKGAEVGILVPKRVREGDEVFKA